jgi:predicted FMN-binding regulatory protein PaiB
MRSRTCTAAAARSTTLTPRAVGIEIRVRAIEGKFKLSQNRSVADREGVVAQLRASGTDNDAALAALMVAAGAPAPRG